MYTGVDAAIDLVRAIFNLAGVVAFGMGFPKLVRRFKVSRLEPSAFPGIDPVRFAAWRGARLRAIDIFLLAAWGLFSLRIVLLVASMSASPLVGLSATLVGLAWFAGLVVAGVLNRRADSLEVDTGIEWPGVAVKAKGSRVCPECATPYDPGDYRSDAANGLCSYCGTTLDLHATSASVPMAAPSATAPQPPPEAPAPAGWHSDPIGRHELRYWDGTTWTAHVSDGGALAHDPLAHQ